MIPATRRPDAATLDWLRRLIAIDTTSSKSNLALIDELRTFFDSRGIGYQVLPNSGGTKANIIATIPAADGSVGGGIVLSGHTDVVPVDGQMWSSDPFELVEREGRFYGRGAADMKAFIAVVLGHVDPALATGLSEPIHIVLSYDEETGGAGAVQLVEYFSTQSELPRACIVGEPSSMRAIRGHKSMTVARVDFRGIAGHSSRTPDGVNAVEYAARFAVFSGALAAEYHKNGARDDAYDVPFTTVSVNTIAGGTAVNIIPADCSVAFEFRSIAADDPATLLDRFQAEVSRIDQAMKQRHPHTGAVLTVLAACPGLETHSNAEVVELVQRCGGEMSAEKVAYGTEAGLFQRAGIPTIVCGPGSIAQAHTPDEYIDVTQLVECEDFIDRLIEHVALGNSPAPN